MTKDTVVQIANASLQRLAKWRSVFAGWQLGTRLSDDGESKAVRDHREVTMLLRTEMNALTRILVEAKLIDQETFTRVVGEEAEYLSRAYEARFPGARAVEEGMVFTLPEWAETMRRMGFPE